MANLNFDARQVEPQKALDPIPAGWYNAKITESEMKPTKDGEGTMLALTLQVIDGQYANRKLFDRLNLQNKNAVAQNIAYQTLSAICHATGVIQVQDSQQLHGIPLMVKVNLRPAGQGKDGQFYDASNEVKGYKAIEGQQAPPPGFAPQQPQQQQAPPPQNAPWQGQQAQPQTQTPPWQQPPVQQQPQYPPAQVPVQQFPAQQQPPVQQQPQQAPWQQATPPQQPPQQAPCAHLNE